MHGTFTQRAHERRAAPDQEEGFIHCSLRHQLPGVAALLYGSRPGPDEL
ncbi:DUF952 domain-containing protein, partial [Streptomyces avermitilis]